MSTPGVGAQYEINVPAYFALKLNASEDVKDFSIRSNVSAEFGNLDDVIIEATLQNGKCLNCAIQLKHRENDRKTISPQAFEIPKDDYSLEKYCSAFKKISQDKRQNYHYILYTNQSFDNSRKNEVKKFVMVQSDQCAETALFNTGSDVKNVYKFKVNDETPSSTSRKEREKITEITKDDYHNFFCKFTLYTCQKKFQEFEKLMLEILKEQSVVNSYLTLFRKWHQGLFTNRTIDRKTINMHLVDIYLSSFKITDYRFCDDENQEMYLFEKATKEFDVTVVNESKDKFLNSLLRFDVDKVELKSSERSKFDSYLSQYKMDSTSTLTECMFRLAKEYKFLERTEMILDKDMKNKIFSFCVQNLLIVHINQYSIETVYKLMKNYQLKEDKIKFILLGHEVDLSKLSSVQVFRNLDDLSKTNDQLYQQITAQCVISFHDRRPVTLKQLLNSLGDVKSVIGTKEIVEILTTGCTIGEKKIKLPPHYVPRNLSTSVFDLHGILNFAKNHKDIILVNFDDRLNQTIEKKIQSEGIQLVGISQYIGNTQLLADKSIILSTNKLTPQAEIEALCGQKSRQFKHVFKLIADDTFILTRSTSKFNTKNSNTKKFPQKDLHSIFDGTLNLLVAEPGMGKSTFMKYVTNESPGYFWPIYAELKSHSKFFSQERSDEEVLNHFMKTELQKSNLVLKLQEVFKERKQVVLCLDGLDELPMNCVDNVLKAIGSLTGKGYRVWMSSRQHLEQQLSEIFNLFSLRLVEFDTEEQKTYIQDRLESEYTEEEMTAIIHRIFEGIQIVNNTQFLGIPLQLYVLTEIFVDKTKQYEDLTESFFVLTKMYWYFFHGRFQHCFGKYETNSPFLTDPIEYLERYEIAALESIFDAKSLNKLQIDSRQNKHFLSKIKSEKDHLGIISQVQEGKAVFEHQTYAEYFVCVWLKNNQSKVNLLKEEIFSKRYEHLRRMLNMILAENNPLHLSIIYRNLAQFEKHIEDVDSRDEAGRTALHIARCNDNRDYRLYYNTSRSVTPETAWDMSVIESLCEKTSKMYEKDNLFNFDWLDYACASDSLFVIDVTLQRNLIEFRTWKQVLYRYYEKDDLVSHCVNCGYPNLLNEIIKEYPEILSGDWRLEEMFERAIKSFRDNVSNKRYLNIAEILIDNRQFRIGKNNVNDNKDTLLHLACNCTNPNEDIINLLVNKGIDVNSRNRLGETPLHAACKSCSISNVIQLLQIGAKVNIPDNGLKTALACALESDGTQTEKLEMITLHVKYKYDMTAKHATETLNIACKEGDLIIVKTLISNGAKFDDETLHYAAKPDRKNETVIDFLLKEHFLNVNAFNRRGETALELACEVGIIQNVKVLLEAGADANIIDNENGMSLLQKIVYNSRVSRDVMILLLQNGAELNHADNAGWNTLHYASMLRNNNAEVIDFLISKDLDVDAPNKNGATALHLACGGGRIWNVKTLVKNGAKVQQLDTNEENALHYAAQIYNSYDSRELIMEFLIVNGSDVNACNKDGTTPFQFACKSGHSASLEMLMKNGADICHVDICGNNALHYASQIDKPDSGAIHLLTRRGIDVNAQNNSGQTALHFACKMGVLQNVKTLVKNGAKVQQLDKNEDNALHYTVKSNDIFYPGYEIIKFLIVNGLDVNACNKDGTTPFQVACKVVDSAYVPILMENGADICRVDIYGNNAFHYAAQRYWGNPVAIDLLTKSGIDVNAQNNYGETALHFACDLFHVDTLISLLKVGADVNILDNKKKKALDYAKCDLSSFGEIRRALESRGLRFDQR